MCVCGLFFFFPSFFSCSSFFRPHVNWNWLVTSVSCMQLLQKLTKHSLLRVREVLKSKADRELKRLLLCHPRVRHYALKILKSTFRLIKVKRRMTEGALITAIYMEIPCDLNDDWLASFYLEKDEALFTADEFLVEGERRAEVAAFNAFHYPNPSSRGNEWLYEDEVGGGSDLDGEEDVVVRNFNIMYDSIKVSAEDFGEQGVNGWVVSEFGGLL